MHQVYGASSVDKYLKKNHDKYLAGRATASIKEVPLLYCDENQDYIYAYKGIEVLYRTGKEIISEDGLLTHIGEFYHVAKESQDKRTAMHWYQSLKKKTPNTKHEVLESQYLK